MLPTTNNCTISNCECETPSTRSYVTKCNCNLHAAFQTRTNTIRYPLPAMIYDYTDTTQSYYSMDTHYKIAKKALKDYQTAGNISDEDLDTTVEIPHGHVVAELSWSSTLETNDLKRKYYLLIHEFDHLVEEVIPDWIPIPHGPPTNSELIIWLASVVDIMQTILSNLVVSGNAGKHDWSVDLHSLSTRNILDDEDRFYDPRNYDFTDVGGIVPLVCSSYRDCIVYVGDNDTSLSPPLKWPLVCGDCFLGSMVEIPSDNPFRVLMCNKCDRIAPYYAPGLQTVNVRLACKVHEMVYLAVYTNNHPCNQLQIIAKLEQLHARMQTNINIFEDGDMYKHLFYYSEEYLVRQHRSFHEMVACLRRIRNAMTAIGYNYKTRSQTTCCEGCKQPPTLFSYVQPVPSIYHYCSIDNTYMKEVITGTRGIGSRYLYHEPAYDHPLNDSACPFDCICRNRYSDQGHNDHDCYVRGDYHRFYELYYNVTGRFKRVKRAAPEPEAEEAPENKKQKNF